MPRSRLPRDRHARDGPDRARRSDELVLGEPHVGRRIGLEHGRSAEVEVGFWHRLVSAEALFDLRAAE